jgi:signal transduction histidine kinase
VSAGAAHRLHQSWPRRLRRAQGQAILVLGLAALVAAVWAAVVLALGRPPKGHEWGLLGLCAGGAAACALLWVPLSRRLTVAAARAAHDDRGDREVALRAFGGRLTRSLPLDELLLQLTETLRRVLSLDAAEVWAGSDGVLELAASDPHRSGGTVILSPPEQSVVARAGVSGPAWAGVWLPGLAEGREEAVSLRIAPITHAGRLLGLLLAERSSGAPLDEADDRLLSDLARQLGLTLRNVELDSALQASLDELRRQAEDLRASRARVVSAADAERRRIERDLHDGAQAHLLGLVVNLRLARELAEPDPAAAKALLEDMSRDARDAVEQIRELAHGIYPALLLDRGLGEALAAAARRPATRARVDAPGMKRYPAEVEAAVYFCCLEALQNTGKHGGPAARATVRLWEEEGALRFEVRDDGAGFDARDAAYGAGLAGMRDRLGALGGRLAIGSSPRRGTTVSGTIPLAP